MHRRPPEVVVVAYGPIDLLRSALDGVRGLAVHVVDNGLSAEVEQLVVGAGLDYVRPPRNLGFGAAVNVGLERVSAGADVLLLNPDAHLSSTDVRELQEALHARPRTAAVAPVLQRPDGSTEPTRWPLPTPTLPWRGVLGRGSLREGEAFFLSGAVLLLSGEALAEVGGFDERFFLYAEESDWQKRALVAGHVVRQADRVVAEHVGAGTSSDSELRERYFHGSAELFVRKWYGTRGWWLFRLGSLAAAARRALTARTPSARRTARLVVRLYLRGPARQLPQAAA